MPREQKIYLAMEDFPQAINMTIENGWVVVWLSNMRVKFKNWISE